MKIAIDASRTVNEKAGIAKYLNNLIQNLAKIDHKNQYLLYFIFAKDPDGTKKRKIEQFKALNWQTKIIKMPGRLKEFLLNQKIMPFPDLFCGKQDVIFTPTFIDLGRVGKNPQVLTIYDLTYFKFPSHLGGKQSAFARAKTKSACQKAAKIIVISEHTKKDLIKILNVPKQKIVVTHLAADAHFRPIKDEKLRRQISQKYNLPAKFILTVGTLSPRKNLPMLFKTFLQLPAKLQKDYHLVVAGQKGWNYQGIFEAAAKLKNEVIFLDYVDDKDLPVIYNLAEIFVFPSLYEGFGLPPLEAMAAGVPVICSNTSSLPEVVGQAGILLPPEDIAVWAKTITETIGNKQLQTSLAQKGLYQAKKFSWAKTAQETLKVFEGLAKNG